MSALPNVLHAIAKEPARKNAQGSIKGRASNELVFAVVGHAGSGTSSIAGFLQATLKTLGPPTGAYDAEILKARDVIAAWAKLNDQEVPQLTAKPTLKNVERFQDLGDMMRKVVTADGREDHPAVARGLIAQIRKIRASKQKTEFSDDKAVPPDGSQRAYIIDSLRHPEEVHILRELYHDAFILIGVVCEEKKRALRIQKKYLGAGEQDAIAFMQRDAESKEKYGQRVGDTFHLSDFFIDNTVDHMVGKGEPNKDWLVVEQLGRLTKIITRSDIERPTSSETAMHHAYGAQLQSACLSRQVGAALMDSLGNIVATGTNEVPQPGGGVYGESFDSRAPDYRCAKIRTGDDRYCSNTREQNDIIQSLIESIHELKDISLVRKQELLRSLRSSRIGSLLEFSRAVHAEMDALLSAAREGISPIGTHLFVTTYPCHYCARHIVTAGVVEVQYIEPYPKSRALDLHDDAIEVEASNWKQPGSPGGKVLFRPFSGIAPRLYRKAFTKDRDLKDNATGVFKLGEPDWSDVWHLPRESYFETEVLLSKAPV